MQLDPLAFDYPYYTPYQYAGCEPIANIDIDGLEPGGVVTAASNMPGIVVTSVRTTAQTASGVSVATMVATTAAKSATRMVVNSAGRLIAEKIVEKTAEKVAEEAVRGSLIRSIGSGSLTLLAVLIPKQAGPSLPPEARGNELFEFNKRLKANYEEFKDPADVSDAYLAKVQRRFMEGKATLNDQRYKDEIDKRIRSGKLKSIIPDLVGFRKDHILNRHRAGTGIPGKSEFPASWSDEKIIDAVNQIANDPNATSGVGKWYSPYKTGMVDGIEIRVDFYPSNHPKYAGKVSTGYPINIPPNP